jgi:PAS domain S-box-containing protein
MDDVSFFKSIIANISDITWEVDENWIFKSISAKTENLMFDPETILGKTPFSFMTAEDAEKLSDQLGTIAINKQNITDLEAQFITHHDIKRYRGIARIINRNTISSRPSQVIIPDSSRSVTRSLLNEKHFRNMFESAPQGIAIADDRGFIIHANRAWKRMFGFTNSDLKHLHMNDFRSDENKLHDQELYNSLLNNKIRLYRIERFFRKKNKQTFWCDLTVKLVNDPEKQHVYAIGLYVDITHRKIIEDDLKNSEEFTRILINGSPFGIGAINDEKLIFTNKAFAEMFGYNDASDITGISIRNLIIKKHIYEFIRASASGESGTKDNTAYEIRAVKKNGAGFVISCTFNLLTIKDRTVLVIFTQDITERKRNEDKLKKFQDGLEKLVEKRTDEIKKLNRQVFKSQESERQRISRDLHDGVGQTILAAKLAINSSTKAKSGNKKKLLDHGMMLMDMASQELREVYTGLFPSILSELGLGDTINWFIRNTLTATGIRVEYNNKLTGPVPQFISINIYRIIQELFNNIIKHSGADFVKITLEEKPDYIISITDNGTGFNIKEIKRRGSGAGLINIKQRVEYMDGKIYISSKPGSTLVIIIIPGEIYDKN